ncbi:hypothetical protein G647_02848 [Cladophialophora carrionii CBS 160.54]|uniref:Uncharacterized protein n=1 Tax=Cladophialophora carrionii CBS 160.54 TaxID=1279043 RepID=V9DHB7_9EURO|nr:uncharacterized protein G647_02848 [Cladophialophora carrionii CBS 160.54]ETI26071.1 hypothetical protein G647_02848 [Cladophialophora carrionii CBS 160.54]
MEGFDDAAPEAREQREDRGPRIPPAKLSTINATPAISIFYKPDKRSPVTLLDSKFPRDAAMIFCDRIRHDIMDNGSKSFTIVGGDLNGHKLVLAWISQCVEEQSIVKFKDLDESIPGFFTTYANVILSSYYLGIPARDLSDHLLKRMTAIARKQLMTWDEVDWFYETAFPSTVPQEKEAALRGVAAASIFWGWWAAKLDSEETPGEMRVLDVMRQENKKLDDDLHAWCERNEKDVRRKWDEKSKAKKYGAQTSNGDGDGAGWDQPAATTEGNSGGWDNAVAENGASGGWDVAAPIAMAGRDNSAAATSSKGIGANTWDSADALNDNDAPFAPPNSLASPEFSSAKNTHTPLLPLSEITNATPFGENDGFGGTTGGGGDWADEVNAEVVDQGQHYHSNQGHQLGNNQW